MLKTQKRITLLMIALGCNCSIKVINRLIELGTDINTKNNYGISPLMYDFGL